MLTLLSAKRQTKNPVPTVGVIHVQFDTGIRPFLLVRWQQSLVKGGVESTIRGSISDHDLGPRNVGQITSDAYLCTENFSDLRSTEQPLLKRIWTTKVR